MPRSSSFWPASSTSQLELISRPLLFSAAIAAKCEGLTPIEPRFCSIYANVRSFSEVDTDHHGGHSRVTQFRNQEDTGGHARSRPRRQSSTGGHWRTRGDTEVHVTAPVRDRATPSATRANDSQHDSQADGRARTPATTADWRRRPSNLRGRLWTLADAKPAVFKTVCGAL